MTEPRKSILLISDCCGKGFGQAKTLLLNLNKAGLTYDLNTGHSKSCTKILERFGIEPKSVKKTPVIYIDDIAFAAEKINDKAYLENLVNNLKIVKEGEKNGLEK